MASQQDLNVSWLLSVLRQASSGAAHNGDCAPGPVEPLRLAQQAETPLCHLAASASPCADVGIKRTFAHVAPETSPCFSPSPSPTPSPLRTRCLFPSSNPCAPDSLARASDTLPSLQPSGILSKGSKGSLDSLEDATRGLHRSLTGADAQARPEANLLRLILTQQQQQQQRRQEQQRKHQHQRQQQQQQVQLVQQLTDLLTWQGHQAPHPLQHHRLPQQSSPLQMGLPQQQPAQQQHHQQPLAPGEQQVDIKCLLAAFLKSHVVEAHSRAASSPSAEEAHRQRAQLELRQLRQIQNLMWDLHCLHSQSMPWAHQDPASNSPAPSSCSGTSGNKKRKMSVDNSEADSSMRSSHEGVPFDLNRDPCC